MKADLDMTFPREERFKETPAGEIPKEWEIVRLKDVVRRVTDITPKEARKRKAGSHGEAGAVHF